MEKKPRTWVKCTECGSYFVFPKGNDGKKCLVCGTELIHNAAEAMQDAPRSIFRGRARGSSQKKEKIV